MKVAEPKTSRLTVNLKPSDREKLRDEAARQERTESWIVEQAIRVYLNSAK